MCAWDPNGRPGPFGFGLCGRLPRRGVGGFVFGSSSSLCAWAQSGNFGVLGLSALSQENDLIFARQRGNVHVLGTLKAKPGVLRSKTTVFAQPARRLSAIQNDFAFWRQKPDCFGWRVLDFFFALQGWPLDQAATFTAFKKYLPRGTQLESGGTHRPITRPTDSLGGRKPPETGAGGFVPRSSSCVPRGR